MTQVVSHAVSGAVIGVALPAEVYGIRNRKSVKLEIQDGRPQGQKKGDLKSIDFSSSRGHPPQRQSECKQHFYPRHSNQTTGG